VHDIFCFIFLDRLDCEIGCILRWVDQDFVIVYEEWLVNSIGPPKHDQYGLCSWSELSRRASSAPSGLFKSAVGAGMVSAYFPIDGRLKIEFK
jgi:hypothetical protein